MGLFHDWRDEVGLRRVGIALTPLDHNGWELVYGILEFTKYPGIRYEQLEGRREHLPDGRVMSVGLPFAGPNACWAQPLLPFKEEGFATINIFSGACNENTTP